VFFLVLPPELIFARRLLILRCAAISFKYRMGESLFQKFNNIEHDFRNYEVPFDVIDFDDQKYILITNM
jgi:hypothetical protein